MKIIFKLGFLLLLFTILISCGTAHQIKKSLKEDKESGAYFKGFVLFNPKKSKEIININGNSFFTPASNTKLFTFYTAYKALGDSIKSLEYFKTKDSLIIKGTADPTLLYYGKDSNSVVNFLIKQSSPVYLLDETIEDEFFGQGWSWDDYIYYYMPEKSLFPIFGNLSTYRFKNDTLQMRPNFFKNQVSIKDSISITRDFKKNNFYVAAKSNKTYEVPFKTSNNLTANLLSYEIGNTVKIIPSKDYEFKPFYSQSKDSVLKRMLDVSDNFIAEQLMLQVGKAVINTFNVNEAIDYSLKNYLPNLPQKPRWVDGSGLSRYNLFSPNDLVYLLNKMYKEIPTQKLLDYFPVWGKTNTLNGWYRNEKPFVFAKSGSLSNNYCLSGYLITKKGTLLIFSSMNNHYMQSTSEVKKSIEEVLKKVYEKY
jgi:D-alanyl-D-alanine carboxypeptidase/D-alanyl-D-alanine-endopeptidase (penicillin-binding protein 4)